MTRIPGGGTGCRPLAALLTAAALAVFSYPAEAADTRNTVLPVSDAEPRLVGVNDMTLCIGPELMVFFLETAFAGGDYKSVEGCGHLKGPRPVPALVAPVENAVIKGRMVTIWKVRFAMPLPALPAQTMFAWTDADGEGS